MYKDNVSINVAIEAKKFGFQWFTDESYDPISKSTAATTYWRRNGIELEDLVMLPTQAQLQEWLRHEFNLEVWVSTNRAIEGHVYYAWEIFEGGVRCEREFALYEDAFDFGLAAAIELIPKVLELRKKEKEKATN